MNKKIIDLLLFLIAIGLLALLIINSNPVTVFNTLSTANVTFIFGAVIITATIILVKIIRWKLLLESIGIKLTKQQIIKPYMASLFVSNITPGRVGEPIRSYYLKRDTGQAISKTLPTVVLERILDLSTLAVFYALGLFVLRTVLNEALIVGIGLIIVIIVVVTLTASSKRVLKLVFNSVYKLFKFIPKIRALRKRIEKLPNNFHSGFVLTTKGKHMSAIVAITIFAWLMEFSILKLAFLAIGVEVPFVILMSVASISTIVALLTFLPGNIGSFEAASAFLLVQVVPTIDLATATSGILLYRLSSLWFALLLSSKYFIKYRI